MRQKAETKAPATVTPLQHLGVPVPFVNQLIQYLMTKPCGEVLGFVEGFGQLAREQGLTPPAVQPPPAKEPPVDG